MSRVSVNKDLLDNLADSISNKFDEDTPLTLAGMKGIVDDITKRSSTDLTASGATVTAPAGYYASSASKSVATGTEGTPTATKGTVSNHQVTITPSVTNTTGYITGSTKTGTAVTVTASELASGNKAISANGTGIDVVGYSTVSVDVPVGLDIPLFTITYDNESNWNIVSKTCTKTFAECYAQISDNTINGMAHVDMLMQDTSSEWTSHDCIIATAYSSSSITYTLFYNNASPEEDLVYYSNGNIELVSPSHCHGTEGTPVATKGTVSNHSVTITPSVLNQQGFIYGTYTKYGTPITVTASELASGSKSIYANGTGIDVVGYSTVDVAVPSGGGNVFLVTLEFDDETGYWVPNQTLDDIATAYGQGKTIVVNCDEDFGFVSAEGKYWPSYGTFEYFVREDRNNSTVVVVQDYVLNYNDTVTLNWEDEYGEVTDGNEMYFGDNPEITPYVGYGEVDSAVLR